MTTTSQHGFKERLRDTLDALGVTQARLATMVSVTPPTVNRWLDGQEPTPATQRYLAAVLGVSHDWLFRGVTYNERPHALRAARERAGLDFRQLAKLTGYSIGVLQAVENGARASEKMMHAISKVLPEFDPAEHLYNSDAPLVLREDAAEATVGTRPRIEGLPADARYVPLLSWAQAGTLDAEHSDAAFDGNGVLACGIKDRTAFALEIKGDSMSPEIKERDRVIVCPGDTVRVGDTVIVRTIDGDVMCKVYQPKGADEITFVSVNHHRHPPFVIHRSQVAWMYPVRQVLRNY